LVTVVFVDLVGSTKLANQLDPERFREVLAAFHGMVTEEVEWLRGRAESFIGDAVLAVFGVPTSHDDDAVRAIRAALSVVNRAPELGRELGLPTPMQVHAGINTGLVAVGTAADRGIVIGGEVNIGARLQQAAAPDEVLVGSTTHQLVKGAVEFGEMRMIVPKEFDGEIPAWPVIRLAPRSTRSTIPFVDRRRELALLSDTSERVRERSRAHLVTLLGEPGIGKTRVVEEFLDGLDDDVTVLSGRPSQYEEQVTFWPLGQMILTAIGGDEDMPSEQLLERLGAAAAGWVGPKDADKVAHRLSLALGLGEDANHENRYHSAEIRRGMLAMIEGLTETRPVVLVFEDLHAAEPLLLDLIERLMRDTRRLPLLVICVARGGFLDERRGWAGGLADAVTLWVEPLAADDAVQLAIEAGDLGRDDALRVAEHAGGNPLFIVEITGMLLREGDVLPPTGVAAPATGPLPPTVQAVIASRIDSLSPAARDLIRKASVTPAPSKGRPQSRRRRAAQGRDDRAGGRGVPGTRAGSQGRVAVPERGAARRRVREPGQARAAAPAPARRKPVVRARQRRCGRADDRVSLGAGGQRGPGSEPARPLDRGPGGRGAREGGRSRASSHRGEVGRGRVRACIGTGGTGGALGRPRGDDPFEAGRVALLAG
jgi:class 3 adenylate cyclase